MVILLIQASDVGSVVYTSDRYDFDFIALSEITKCYTMESNNRKNHERCFFANREESPCSKIDKVDNLIYFGSDDWDKSGLYLSIKLKAMIAVRICKSYSIIFKNPFYSDSVLNQHCVGNKEEGQFIINMIKITKEASMRDAEIYSYIDISDVELDDRFYNYHHNKVNALTAKACSNLL